MIENNSIINCKGTIFIEDGKGGVIFIGDNMDVEVDVTVKFSVKIPSGLKETDTLSAIREQAKTHAKALVDSGMRHAQSQYREWKDARISEVRDVKVEVISVSGT